MYYLRFTIYDLDRVRRAAILLTVSALSMGFAGCNNKTLDPGQIGRFRPTPAVNVILNSLGVAEETPVEEAPPASREGSGSIDQAEMRQRIEETRARLKAKAFDAMMSGEAALLSRDSGEKPVPTADDIKLDNDVESTIDESLSQEDS